MFIMTVDHMRWVIPAYGAGTTGWFLNIRGCHGYMMAGNQSDAMHSVYHVIGLHDNYGGGWHAPERVWLTT